MKNDDGQNESKKLQDEFLSNIPEKRKETLVKRAGKISAHVGNIWKQSGHAPVWTNVAHIDTGRNINYPKDESLYARRDAHCKKCGCDMWLIVHEVKTVIQGGSHRCCSPTKKS